MNLCFITDFSESRNQSGFTRFSEYEFWRISAQFCQIVANSGRTRRFTDSFTDTGTACSRNALENPHLEVEPMAGIEPATDGLRNRCSTTELHWQPDGAN